MTHCSSVVRGSPASSLIWNDAPGECTGGNSLKPQYTEIYTKLVMDASKNYGPNLHVFMACGPMSEVYCPPIQHIIKTVQAHGVKAHFLDQVRCSLPHGSVAFSLGVHGGIIE